jgi:uncharacterized protein (DUF305 family)
MEEHATDLSTAHDVDQAFAEAMIAHHKGALRMARLAEVDADHEELTSLADDIIAAQEREIDVMQAHAMEMH